MNNGEVAQARAILAELHQRVPRSYVGAYDFAIVHLGLGERDEAFGWLDKSVDEHSSWLADLAYDPRLHPLRGDTHFARLLERVGLSPAEIAAGSKGSPWQVDVPEHGPADTPRCLHPIRTVDSVLLLVTGRDGFKTE
jgi:hypothetical protein